MQVTLLVVLLLTVLSATAITQRVWVPGSAVFQPRKKLILVKLGGSALTDKSSFESLKHGELSAIANDLKDAHDGGSSLVVVHGAGSFGHHHAKRFNLSTGGCPDTWVEGVSKTLRSVTKLNQHVLKALHSNRLVTTVGINPFPDGIDFLQVESIVARGFLPVLHGTIVLTGGQSRCRVLSGDTILSLLTRSFGESNKYTVHSCVFLTDVDGVYDKNPKLYSDAKIVNSIRVGRDGRPKKLHVTAREARGVEDVTGGILSKLSSAFEIASRGVPVYIVKAGSRDAQRVLSGFPPTGGTSIFRV